MIPENKRADYLDQIRNHYGDISNADAEEVLERIDRYARLLVRQANRVRMEEIRNFDSESGALYDEST